MAQAFPNFIALHYSSGALLYRHMRMISENTNSWRGHLAFDRREVVAPATKFELEPAELGNGRFKHIRCCYSNKYLALKAPDSRWITASVDKMEEDLSKFSCTLFEPIGVSGGKIQLRHVATGWLAAIFSSPGLLLTPALYLSDRAVDDDLSRFTVRDWESILILPRHLVFKADNGKCLSGRVMTFGPNRIGILRFNGDDDIGDSTVSHTTRYSKDGRVMFISRFTGGFWDKPSSQNNEIYANGVIGIEFTPVKLGNDSNKVALSMYGRFCRRQNLLFIPDSTTTTKETQLEIKEAIFYRSIYNIRYRLMDARIYNENVQTMTPASNFDNRTSQPQASTRQISYSQTESSTWDNSVVFNLGIETTFQTGIPFIAKGEITTSLNVGYGYEWGKTKSETKNLSVAHTVVVPPRSRVRVTLLATKGMCDVPFSYTQRDTLFDGRQVITFHEDGLYTGVTYYNFKYQTTRADL